MRVAAIHVEAWRNLRGIHLEIPIDVKLVCLVGSNGTGKSNLLELISAAAAQVGISSGFDAPRGYPFSDPCSMSIVFQFTTDEIRALQEFIAAHPDRTPHPEISVEGWNGMLKLESIPGDGHSHTTTTALGFVDLALSQSVARKLESALHQQESMFHLRLDADRSYPPVTLTIQQLAEALSQDLGESGQNRQRSGANSKQLYDEWVKYFVSVENRAATAFYSGFRAARSSGNEPPEFIDVFSEYRNALTEVIPTLKFESVDPDNRTILFNPSGVTVPFNSLSGGEKEVAFILGQLDRFRLRQGLLLIDEPELHLNPALIRRWISYLSDTIEEGQVWVATHSLEACEVAGAHATVVLERNSDDRLVSDAFWLQERPVVAALSRALGSPAYSIGRHRVVYVEGRTGIEATRFSKFFERDVDIKFVEAGSSREVGRSVNAVRRLALETGDHIRVGAVMDRDFKSDAECQLLASETGVLILDCHEVENLYLDPAILGELLRRNGKVELSAVQLIVEASDRLAGLWVAQRFLSLWHGFSGGTTAEVKAVADEINSMDWLQCSARVDCLDSSCLSEILNDGTDSELVSSFLKQAVEDYRSLRESNDLWCGCLGKQVLADVFRRAGFSGSAAYEHQATLLLREGIINPSAPLAALFEYAAGL